MSRPRLSSRRNQIRRQHQLRAKCVSGKKRYRTEEQAQAALDRIQHADNTDRVKVPQRVYACPYCAGWHCTSQRVPLQARTPIPARSMKAAKVYRDVRVPLVVEILTEHPFCQIRFDESCTGRATTVHEIKKRSRGGSITDKANCLSACVNCNEAVENFPVEAHARGFAMNSWEDAS